MLQLARVITFALLFATSSAGFAQAGKTIAVLGLGKNYREIPQQPVATPGRIEVIDFFFYGCPFCNELRPMLERWRAGLSSEVMFRRVPAVRRDAWAPLARTYYTLESLGEVERLHEQVYKGYHDEELHMSQPDVMADWAARHGIDREKWLSVYRSEETTRKVEEARKMTQDYDIQGTPSIVIGGRYLTSSGMTDDVKLVVPVAELLLELVRSRR